MPRQFYKCYVCGKPFEVFSCILLDDGYPCPNCQHDDTEWQRSEPTAEERASR